MVLVALLFPYPTFADTVIETSTGTTEITGFGLTGGNPVKIGQSFTTTQAGTIASVQVLFMSIQAQTDDVYLAIQADSAGFPSGTDLATATINGTGVLTSCGAESRRTFTFASPLAVADATVYWIVITRQTPAGYPNGYSICGSGSSVYAGGLLAQHDGSSWAQTGGGDREANSVLTIVSAGGGAAQPTSKKVAFWW